MGEPASMRVGELTHLQGAMMAITVQCGNRNHLFKVQRGWVSAKMGT